MRRVWLGFAALCLLGGTVWIYDTWFPQPLSGLGRLAVHDGAIALVAGAIWSRRRARIAWGRIGAGSLGMFALPSVLSVYAGGSVSGAPQLLLAMLASVVVVLAVAQREMGFGVDEGPLRRLIPALAGIGGAWLVLPLDWPESFAGRVWVGALVAAAIVSALTAVWLHEVLQGQDLAGSVAVIAGVAALVAAVCNRDSWSLGWSAAAIGAQIGRLVLFDGPALWLTVWLLREMKPVALVSRLFFVPLLIVVGSYAVARPQLDWTSWLGAVLLAIGAFGMLTRADSAKMLGAE